MIYITNASCAKCGAEELIEQGIRARLTDTAELCACPKCGWNVVIVGQSGSVTTFWSSIESAYMNSLHGAELSQQYAAEQFDLNYCGLLSLIDGKDGVNAVCAGQILAAEYSECARNDLDVAFAIAKMQAAA